MTERFNYSTKKTLFKPIEVEIDGKVYRTERIPFSLLKKVMKFEEKAATGDIDAVMGQLKLLLGVPEKILEEIDVRDLEAMLAQVSAKIFNPVGDVEEDEKNSSRPEPKESP